MLPKLKLIVIASALFFNIARAHPRRITPTPSMSGQITPDPLPSTGADFAHRSVINDQTPDLDAIGKRSSKFFLSHPNARGQGGTEKSPAPYSYWYCGPPGQTLCSPDGTMIGVCNSLVDSIFWGPISKHPNWECDGKSMKPVKVGNYYPVSASYDSGTWNETDKPF